MCGLHLSVQVQELDNLKFFKCGHGFHEGCLGSQAECPQCALEARFGSTVAAELAAGQTSQAAPGGLFKAGTQQQQAQQGDDGPADIRRMLRRLRHTKLKLEGGRNYRDILDGLLAKDQAGGLQESRKGSSMSARGLLLAPAPPEPQVSGNIFVGRLADAANASIKEIFTAEEIVEIFGAHANFSTDAPLEPDPQEVARDEVMPSVGGDHGVEATAPGGGDDDLDW
jgi:hypothetical protein